MGEGIVMIDIGIQYTIHTIYTIHIHTHTPCHYIHIHTQSPCTYPAADRIWNTFPHPALQLAIPTAVAVCPGAGTAMSPVSVGGAIRVRGGIGVPVGKHLDPLVFPLCLLGLPRNIYS